MSSNSFYAVHKGFKTGIFKTWSECLDAIKGYSNPVYKKFNIGSSKPSPTEQQMVPHHLIDLLNPEDPFSSFDFVKKADEAISDIWTRNKIPLVVGGTYFYLKGLQNGMYAIPPIDGSVVEAIENEFGEEEGSASKMHEALTEQDPNSASSIHPNDRYRLVRALAIIRATGQKPSSLTLAKTSPEASNRLWLKYALLVPRHELTQLIAQRTDKLLSNGIVEETRFIRESHAKAKALSSIGYAECIRFLNKEIDEKQLRNEIIEKTRQLAKRQMTWLRSDPEVRFIDHRDEERVFLEISNLRFVLDRKGVNP
jgi:tRNA dimethylallyltransferase